MVFAATFIHVAPFGGSLIFAFLCALIAHGRNRSPLLWGLAGFFLSLVAFLVLLFLDAPEAPRCGTPTRHDHRRLKEGLRKQGRQLKALSRELHERMDHHDELAGIDTRKPPHTAIPGAASCGSGPCWFYEEGGQTAGPVTTRALGALVQAGVVRPHTLVWRDGMPDWKRFDGLSA